MARRRRQPDKTAVAPQPRASEFLAIFVAVPSYTGRIERSIGRTDVVRVCIFAWRAGLDLTPTPHGFLKAALVECLEELDETPGEELRRRRRAKFRGMGVFA